MNISPEHRWKNADVELANAGIELERAKEGRSKLVALRDKHDAEYSAALQNWSREKTDKALTRMRDARSQLNTVRELLGEDAVPYAKAEAELEHCKAQMTQVEVVRQAIELAGALGRQQEYFSDDVQELQRQFVELMDKLRKTADAWDDLHRHQYKLATEAGLSAEQLQHKVEAWGFAL
jgi:septation ring formation regulator EzrA